MHLAGFSFVDANKCKLWINVNSPVESDVDVFVREVSRLPTFNSTLSTPFHELMFRKNIARVIDFMVFPSLFVLSVWLPVRSLRKRHVAGWRQALVIAGISGVWLIMLHVTPPIYLPGIFGPTFATIWESNAGARFSAIFLIALTSLVLASLIFLSFSLRWLVLRMCAVRR
jgi:hypothetical protein